MTTKEQEQKKEETTIQLSIEGVKYDQVNPETGEKGCTVFFHPSVMSEETHDRLRAKQRASEDDSAEVKL